MDIVTRFAPSPTGYLHIGGLRTALYSYLFAKKNQGTLILRIEDTDQTRYVEGSVENLIKSLEWGGIKFDEGPHIGGEHGPYMQSERTELYRKHAQELIESGHAYKCFCTKERLDEMRAHQQKHKQPPMYDRQCLYLEPEQIKEKEDAGIPYVIRLKIPHDQTINYHDIVRGDMEFKGHTIDDQVLVKSDGFPTYHLANVVDDHLMKVTHVIRGEEWLPSTPKHIFLYHAFGWNEPQFAHIPLLLNEDKTKLSKRQGHVAVEEYIQEGYISEAVVNYIAMLGWNPGSEQEIFTMDELIEAFELSRVQKAGAIFSMTKLNWFNKQYLKNLSISELAEKITPYMHAANMSIPEDTEFFHQCIKLTFERYNTFSDAPGYLKCLFESPAEYDTELFIHEKMNVDKKMSLDALQAAVKKLNEMDEFNEEESVKTVLTEVIGELGVKNGQVLWPIRVALTNEKFSPGVFELLVLLKKERAIPRMLSAIEALKN